MWRAAQRQGWPPGELGGTVGVTTHGGRFNELFDEGGEAGLLKSIGVLDPVLDRIEDALRANDLWDTRRV